MNNGSQKAKDKYLKEKVDSFVMRVPKGAKETIQSRAKELGKSLNGYIFDLIKNDIPSLDTTKAQTKSAAKPKSSLPSFLD